MQVRAAAAEIPAVPLRDALEVCELLRLEKPEVSGGASLAGPSAARAAGNHPARARAGRAGTPAGAGRGRPPVSAGAVGLVSSPPYVCNPGPESRETPCRRGCYMRPGRLELPPHISGTRPSTLRVYQFRHRRLRGRQL